MQEQVLGNESAERQRVVANERRHGELLARGDPELLWGWQTPAGQLRAERRARLVSEAAGLGPESKVLEVGCGTGLFTELWSKTGAAILAVDLSPDLLERARARGLPSRVSFVETPFEDCQAQGPFSAVIGNSVLHHLDVDVALLRIQELLQPGGVMAFAEPNLANPQIFLERRFPSWFDYVSPDETAFLRGRLTKRLQRLGFVDVRVEPFDWLHPFTPPRLIPVVRGLGAVLERLPIARRFAGSLIISARKSV